MRKNKGNELYYSEKTYNNIISIIFILPCCLYILGWTFSLIASIIQHSIEFGEIILMSIGLVIGIYSMRLYSQIRLYFLLKSTEKIEDNINQLPDKIGNHKVLVQYTAPKGLSPSEVGFLYYQSSSFAFINCLPYKWKNEYKFITDFGGTTIQSLTGGHLDNIPEYEKYCWELLYGNNHYKDIAAITHFSKVPDNNLIVEKYKVGRLILKYCKEKGWINVAANTRGRLNCLIVGFQLLTSFIPIFILFFRGINSLRGFFLELSESKYFSWNKIILTDEGERLLAHIYGYKYFLEKCEEEQINKNRELDPNFISDHLPYAIALKLNGQLMK